MLITVASVVWLAAVAVMLLHWWLRGGRLFYRPISHAGKIIEGLGYAGVLLLTIMALVGRVGPDVNPVTTIALLLLEFSYSSWRREREHQRKSSVA